MVNRPTSTCCFARRKLLATRSVESDNDLVCLGVVHGRSVGSVGAVCAVLCTWRTILAVVHQNALLHVARREVVTPLVLWGDIVRIRAVLGGLHDPSCQCCTICCCNIAGAELHCEEEEHHGRFTGVECRARRDVQGRRRSRLAEPQTSDPRGRGRRYAEAMAAGKRRSAQYSGRPMRAWSVSIVPSAWIIGWHLSRSSLPSSRRLPWSPVMVHAALSTGLSAAAAMAVRPLEARAHA